MCGYPVARLQAHQHICKTVVLTASIELPSKCSGGYHPAGLVASLACKSLPCANVGSSTGRIHNVLTVLRFMVPIGKQARVRPQAAPSQAITGLQDMQITQPDHATSVDIS
jgi:hypothetical protein